MKHERCELKTSWKTMNRASFQRAFFSIHIYLSLGCLVVLLPLNRPAINSYEFLKKSTQNKTKRETIKSTAK